MSRKVRVGTRGSDLALAQTGFVVADLRAANPGAEFETTIIRTSGDRDQRVDISSVGYGVFVKELESALANGEVDIAVHSMKDMPSTLEPGFVIPAVPYREDPRDALITKSGVTLMELPKAATVATGSSRRKALLLDKRPDLNVVPLRGNVPTRLAKLDDAQGPDAIVLAAAGLKRLNLEDRITEFLACGDFVAAVGQGALAIETRADDVAVIAMASPLEFTQTHNEVDAERAFLAKVESGCSAPVSAHARQRDGQISMNAFAADVNGKTVLRGERKGEARNGIALAIELAEDLLARGAGDLLGNVEASAND